MLLQRLHQHARERGDQIAMRSLHEGHAVSYASLWTMALAKGAALAEAGLASSEVALIFAPHGIDGVVTFLGAMVSGGIPSLMPLPSDRQDPAHFWLQHEQLFQHIGHGMVLVPEASFEAAQAIARDLPLRVLTLESLCGETPPPLPHADAGRVALLQHSSGTTGLKKGVALTYAQLESQVAAYAERLDMKDGHRIISWLPLYHDMGLIACLITPLTLGIEVVYLDPFRWVLKPQSLFDAIEQYRGTHVWLPNFAFLHLVRAVRAGGRRWDLSSVEAFVNCSEPCKPHAFDAFAERWRDHGVHLGMLTCCYAMAETVFAVSQTPPGQPARRVRVAAEGYGTIGRPVRVTSGDEPAMELLSCGRPLSGVEVRLVDEAGTPVPDGCYGEIQVTAPFLFSGYYKNPERTGKALGAGRYRTGDVGMMLGGEIFVCGRVDDMIIVNGRNLYAHEIEKITASVEGVLPGRVVAFAIFQEDIGSNQLVVVAETDVTDEAKLEEMSYNIGNEILTAVGVLPTDVRMVPRKTILKTTSGKVDRLTNMRRYADDMLTVWGGAKANEEADT